MLARAIRHISNPRVEEETHYYNPKYTALQKLGLVPHDLTSHVVVQMLETALRHRARVDTTQVDPIIDWR
jgi:UDP-sulfoquinovose synthase